MKKFTKKVLSIVLCALLVLSIMPMNAFAATITVNGKSYENCGDISNYMGQKNYSTNANGFIQTSGIDLAMLTSGTYYTAGAGYVTYEVDSSTATLTLHNATITAPESDSTGSTNSCAIMNNKNMGGCKYLIINFSGTNFLYGGNGPESAGLNCTASTLTLNGVGENAVLNATAANAARSGELYSSGIYVNKTVTINSGTVNATGGTATKSASYGLCCVYNGGLTLAEGAVLNCKAGTGATDSAGIYIARNAPTVNGTIELNNNKVIFPSPTTLESLKYHIAGNGTVVIGTEEYTVENSKFVCSGRAHDFDESGICKVCDSKCTHPTLTNSICNDCGKAIINGEAYENGTLPITITSSTLKTVWFDSNGNTAIYDGIDTLTFDNFNDNNAEGVIEKDLYIAFKGENTVGSIRNTQTLEFDGIGAMTMPCCEAKDVTVRGGDVTISTTSTGYILVITGNFNVFGGTVYLSSGDDGVKVGGDILVDGGTLTGHSNFDVENATIKSGSIVLENNSTIAKNFNIEGGEVTADLLGNQGTLTVNGTLRAQAIVNMSGGTCEITSGDVYLSGFDLGDGNLACMLWLDGADKPVISESANIQCTGYAGASINETNQEVKFYNLEGTKFICLVHSQFDEKGYCTDCGEIDPDCVAAFDGYTISLGGNIAVNYYVTLTEKALADENTKMVFTTPNGETVEVPVSEATMSGDYYVFTCEVAAKEMTSNIAAQVITSDDASVVSNYSVKEYAEYILDKGNSSSVNEYTYAVPLVKSMLNYGATAQIYFDYNTENLANDSVYMSEADKVVTEYDMSDYAYTLTGEQEGVSFYGGVLSLESETAVKVYFRIDDTSVLDNITVGGEKVTAVENGSYYEIKISDIPAHHLGATYEIKVGEVTLVYGPYNYAYSALNTDNEELKNVVKAMVAYSVESNFYNGN